MRNLLARLRRLFSRDGGLCQCDRCRAYWATLAQNDEEWRRDFIARCDAFEAELDASIKGRRQ